ncbi:hypothetical protein D3C72_1180380 [compost metagenome]
MVQVHKAEGLIDSIVHQRQIQLVMLGDTLPVGDAGTAERIDAQLQAGTLNRRHINHVHQPFNIWLHQVLCMHTAAGPGLIQRLTLNAFQLQRQQFIGALFNHRGQIGIRRAAVGRVIFDAAIFRRIVGRGDHDAVGQCPTVTVVAQDGMGDRRRWREAIIFLHDHINAVGAQHFQH